MDTQGLQNKKDLFIQKAQEIIRERLIYNNSSRGGPYSGGTRSISWSEGKVRGRAYIETENFHVLCVQAISSYEQEIFDDYSRFAVASGRAESVSVSSSKSGRIIVFYQSKANNVDDAVEMLSTSSHTLESLSEMKYNKDKFLIKCDHVSVNHLGYNLIEVSWQTKDRHNGPGYRIDLAQKYIVESATG